LLWRKSLVLVLVVLFTLSCFGLGCKKQETAPPEETPSEQPAEQPADTGPTPGGTLYLSMWSAPEGMFNDTLSESLYDSYINDLIYDALIGFDDTLAVVPELAESWEVSEDNLTITFKLRENAVFHDGHPVTAEDVEFTFTSMCHPEYQGVRYQNFAQILGAEAYHNGEADSVEGIKVIDEHTISFTLAEPFSPFLVRLGFGILPKHLLKDVPPAEMPAHAFNKNPVGCGPFKFTKYETDQYIELTAFGDYYVADRPYLDRIIYKILNQDVALAQLEKGEVDCINVDPADIEAVQELSGIHMTEYADLGYQYMGMNATRDFFADAKVRQAFVYAINRQAIVDQLLVGHGEVLNAPMPRCSWAFSEKMNTYDYDPDKAQALLAEAGWTDSDGDGILDKDGKPFAIELLYPSGNKVREASAPVIQADLKKIGVDVTLNMLEFATLVPRIFEERDFDCYLMGWSLSIDPDPTTIWHSSQSEPGGWNPVGFVSEESDRLMKEATLVYDKAQRSKYYEEWQVLVNDWCPYVFLYSINEIWAINDRVENLVPGAQGFAWNCTEWWIPEDLQ